MTEESSKETVTSAEKLQDHLVTSSHTIEINGKEIHYTVTVGTMVISQESTKAEVYQGESQRYQIFFTAYTLDEPGDLSKRPITFSYNGGPGSSSMWVHLGFLGPRRVKLDSEGNVPEFPAPLTDNPYSILDMTDLVFVDPVTTGFSRALPENKVTDFIGYSNDIQSVSDFIRTYITRNKRWTSPKYLAGESYGTARSVGVADYLSTKFGMDLNGIMLISTAIDYSTLRFVPGNDLPYILFLPTYAADAWFHKKAAARYLKMDLPAFMDEARAFAGGEYMRALFLGTRLDEAEKERIARKLADFTGLSKEYVLNSNLRIVIHRFCKELLRSEHLVIGRFDGRYTGNEGNNAGEKMEGDPSSYQLRGAFAGAVNAYFSQELGYEDDKLYRLSNNYQEDLGSPWSYKEFENRFMQQEEILQRTMQKNRNLKTWVLCGYYDLATPFFAAEWIYSHVFLEGGQKENLKLTYYPSGHMIYMHEPSLKKFREQAKDFYNVKE